MFRFLLLLPMLHAADWPQLFGPNRDGNSPEKVEILPWEKSGPKVLWSVDVGSGWSSPVVVGKRVFVFHRIDNDELLDCLDLKTGKSILRLKSNTAYRDEFNFDDGPRATPIIDGKRAYTLGADGDLSGWDIEAGKQIWARSIKDDYAVPQSFFGTASSPILIGEKLLVNVGGKNAGVVAFDPATGKEIWKSGSDGVSYSSPVTAKIDDELLAVFYTRQGLLAVEPEKGAVRYSYEWRPRINASVNAANPIVLGNRIFISTSYQKGAIVLEASKGELKKIWSGDDSLSCHYNTPILVGEQLFGIDGRQEGGGNLRCIDFATGKVKWTEKGFGCATLTKIGNNIIALTEKGDLVLFEASAEKYRELARSAIVDVPARAAFAYSDNCVVARGKKKLVAVEFTTKKD